MNADRRMDRNMLWVLAAGFALTIAFLVGSAWLSVKAVDAVETRSEELLARHHFSTRLIDEIQGEKEGLSGLFYALVAEPQPANRASVLARLETIESDARRT